LLFDDCYCNLPSVFHPLSRFRAPIRCRSRLPKIIGPVYWHNARYVHDCHEKYGDFVTKLDQMKSASSTSAWKDVHGHPTKREQGCNASQALGSYGSHYQWILQPCGCSGRRSHTHAPHFQSRFSDRALKEQEPLFMKVHRFTCHKIKGGIKEDPIAYMIWFDTTTRYLRCHGRSTIRRTDCTCLERRVLHGSVSYSTLSSGIKIDHHGHSIFDRTSSLRPLRLCRRD